MLRILDFDNKFGFISLKESMFSHAIQKQ